MQYHHSNNSDPESIPITHRKADHSEPDHGKPDVQSVTVVESIVNSQQPDDLPYMQFALDLAKQLQGQTGANPSVGAVLVKDARIIGFGAHLKQGTAHAEIQAIKMAEFGSAGASKGSTLYVTLEPCCHHGKTPPCVEAIVKAGIKRVVIAVQDHNPLVAGKGIAYLRAHQIEVVLGILQEEATILYRQFFRTQFTQRSFVTLKTASSLDSKMATVRGESKWITCEASRSDVHRLRSQCDAILTGIGTVLADDPFFTVRLPYVTGQPARIILDRKGRLPFESNIVFTARNIPTLLFGDYPVEKAQLLTQKGCTIYPYTELSTILQQLLRLGFGRILVEAGPTLTSTFLAENFVDEWIHYQSPRIFGEQSHSQTASTPNADSLQTMPKSQHALFTHTIDLPLEHIPYFEVDSVEKIGTDIKSVLFSPNSLSIV